MRLSDKNGFKKFDVLISSIFSLFLKFSAFLNDCGSPVPASN